MLLPMQGAPVLLVSAVGKGSHLLLSVTESAGSKRVPVRAGEVELPCEAAQIVSPAFTVLVW